MQVLPGVHRRKGKCWPTSRKDRIISRSQKTHGEMGKDQTAWVPGHQLRSVKKGFREIPRGIMQMSSTPVLRNMLNKWHEGITYEAVSEKGRVKGGGSHNQGNQVVKSQVLFSPAVPGITANRNYSDSSWWIHRKMKKNTLKGEPGVLVTKWDEKRTCMSAPSILFPKLCPPEIFLEVFPSIGPEEFYLILYKSSWSASPSLLRLLTSPDKCSHALVYASTAFVKHKNYNLNLLCFVNFTHQAIWASEAVLYSFLFLKLRLLT